jgi:hypothetical protein
MQMRLSHAQCSLSRVALSRRAMGRGSTLPGARRRVGLGAMRLAGFSAFGFLRVQD